MNEHDDAVASARETELQRYVDHELNDPERTAFEAKLLRDPALRDEVDGLRALRKVFRASAEETAPQPSAGFRARVLARAATAAELESVTTAAGSDTDSLLNPLLVWAKRSLIAAAVIAGLSLLVLSGALRSADSGRLEASEADVQKAMAELDAQMRAASPSPAAEGR